MGGARRVCQPAIASRVPTQLLAARLLAGAVRWRAPAAKERRRALPPWWSWLPFLGSGRARTETGLSPDSSLDLLSRSRGTPLSLYTTGALRRPQLCSCVVDPDSYPVRCLRGSTAPEWRDPNSSGAIEDVGPFASFLFPVITPPGHVASAAFGALWSPELYWWRRVVLEEVRHVDGCS